MIRRPPRSTQSRSSAASDVYKRQQYAHARISAVLGLWGGERQALLQADVSLLDSDYETTLLQKLIDYPQVIENAAQDLASHLIAFYLKDLAADFHSYYNASRFLVEDEAVSYTHLRAHETRHDLV